MGKSLPTDDPYGESWELHDTATVLNGPLAGKSLGALLVDYGTALIGAGNDPADGFPLLAKLLDASDWLSVQVHPNDEQAHQLEGDPRGKTEAWVILSAEPDSQLVIGVLPGTSREQMAQAIRDNTLESRLVYADVRPGDVLYIPANTIHAIGPGIVLYEIQQSSDVTYRLYDWGRMGLDGKPRALHIDKGVQVSNVESLPAITHPDHIMVESPFFRTLRYTLTEGEQQTIVTAGHFHALTCIDGTITITQGDTHLTLSKGQTALVPACLDRYLLGGQGAVLCSHQVG